jgi:Na+-driven multidrug efflux pump
MGLDGAAYANLLSQVSSALFLLIYVIFRDFINLGTESGTWPGFQIAKALERKAVRQYMGYGIPACAMICLEWQVFNCHCLDNVVYRI